MLTFHIEYTVNNNVRLQQILAVTTITETTNWQQISDYTTNSSLSSGETALAHCLCALAGATTPHTFGENFQALDARDMDIILHILTQETDDTHHMENPLL